MLEQFLVDIIMNFGYLGIFVVSAISSASIIFPLPFALIAIPAGALLNPFIVAIVGGLGAAVGELVGYGVGAGGKLVSRPEHKKWFRRAKKWMKGRRAFFVILAFAATPLPDDIVGLLAGFLRYDIRKFFVAAAIGKIIMFMFLAYLGYYGYDYLVGLL